MQLEIIKLNFDDTPLHISDGRGLYYFTDEILHSDKLKNAIFVSAAQLFGSGVLTEKFYDSFTVSSAFPFFENEYFFPRPNCQLEFNNANEKKIKKIKYLGKTLYEKYLNANTDFSSSNFRDFKTFNEGRCLSENNFKNINIDKFIFKQAQDRVDLSKGESVPFYMETMRFHHDAGLYFIIKWKDSSDISSKILFQQAISILADEGIGSDRTYGFGRFEIIKNNNSFFHKIDLNTPSVSKFQTNLGLYRPNQVEQNLLKEDLPQSNFSIIERGGFIANPEDLQFLAYRKHIVNFFETGSIFPFRKERIGEKINLQPIAISHPVWREGKSIFIPIKEKNV